MRWNLQASIVSHAVIAKLSAEKATGTCNQDTACDAKFGAVCPAGIPPAGCIVEEFLGGRRDSKPVSDP
jgi:hypothetical protein